VREICDAAVRADADKSRDYRGINYLANRDYSAAIKDLAPFLSDSSQTPSNEAARQLLIESINNGINPLLLRAPDPKSASNQNDLCRTPTRFGFASLPEVRKACDLAVNLTDGMNLHYRDSRGLNRAMNGDFNAAIEDFKAFIKSSTGSPQDLAKRQIWINELAKGKYPFTVDVLRQLH
jgi:hypothetical protein